MFGGNFRKLPCRIIEVLTEAFDIWLNRSTTIDKGERDWKRNWPSKPSALPCGFNKGHLLQREKILLLTVMKALRVLMPRWRQ